MMDLETLTKEENELPPFSIDQKVGTGEDAVLALRDLPEQRKSG